MIVKSWLRTGRTKAGGEPIWRHVTLSTPFLDTLHVCLPHTSTTVIRPLTVCWHSESRNDAIDTNMVRCFCDFIVSLSQRTLHTPEAVDSVPADPSGGKLSFISCPCAVACSDEVGSGLRGGHASRHDWISPSFIGAIVQNSTGPRAASAASLDAPDPGWDAGSSPACSVVVPPTLASR